jgi:hypothetical protein
LRLRSAAVPSVLVVDNYDSFTFNLVQYLGELGADCEVVRNDARTVDEIEAHPPIAFSCRRGRARRTTPASAST